jgi:hypothetical protein
LSATSVPSVFTSLSVLAPDFAALGSTMASVSPADIRPSCSSTVRRCVMVALTSARMAALGRCSGRGADDDVVALDALARVPCVFALDDAARIQRRVASRANKPRVGEAAALMLKIVHRLCLAAAVVVSRAIGVDRDGGLTETEPPSVLEKACVWQSARFSRR